MNKEQFEKFLIQNKMIKESGEEITEEESKESAQTETKEAAKKPSTSCVYCLISSKQIESISIYEDKDYLAALEINPFSPGHIILIPKEHVKETKALKAKALIIADKIGKHIIKKLGAENFQITSSDDMKHAIVNIIPVYKDKPLTFERKPAKKQDLQDLAMKIGKIEKKQSKPRAKKEKKEESKNECSPEKPKSGLPKMNRRIP
jgi:diadenosine tetraphosphate (Ap4A) HIT family hydrolase